MHNIAQETAAQQRRRRGGEEDGDGGAAAEALDSVAFQSPLLQSLVELLVCSPLDCIGLNCIVLYWTGLDWVVLFGSRRVFVRCFFSIQFHSFALSRL